jgi:hypothetical protein
LTAVIRLVQTATESSSSVFDTGFETYADRKASLLITAKA